jgi:hypothetical protein
MANQRRVLDVSRSVCGSQRFTLEIIGRCKLSDEEIVAGLNSGEIEIDDNALRDGNDEFIGAVKESELDIDTHEDFSEG